MTALWTFALPPTVGARSNQATSLRAALGPAGCGFLAPSTGYDELAAMLIRGEAQAGWAPPIVAARVEEAGGWIVLQAVRGGTRSYRSALFSRRGLTLSPQSLQFKRAAWVDRNSISGYLLPTALLRGAGIDPDKTFSGQLFTGSVQECVQAVLDGRADVSGCFASPPTAGKSRVGFMQLAGSRLQELVVLAYSGECPHDGIALSPTLDPVTAGTIAEALQERVRNADLLAGMEADAFEQPTPGTYAPLLQYLQA